MPLDRLVLIIVIVLAAGAGTIWLAGFLMAATQVPFAWIAVIPVALAAWIGWRVITDRVTSEEDDRYDRTPRK
jgi:hypothetical protein